MKLLREFSNARQSLGVGSQQFSRGDNLQKDKVLKEIIIYGVHRHLFEKLEE